MAADPREAIEYILGSLEKLLDSKLDHIHVDQLLDKAGIAIFAPILKLHNTGMLS